MPIKLYPYQESAVSLLKQRGGRAGLFMGMGTGKTPTTIHYLNDVKAKCIVVICPLSAVGVWRREIRQSKLGWRVLTLSQGSIKSRGQLLRRMPQQRRPTAVLVNYAAFWRSPLKEALLKLEPDTIVADEAHRLKGGATRQSRFAFQLAEQKFVQRRLALTGSLANPSGKPNDSSGGVLPQDVFAIYRFIDKTVFGTVWADFDRHYIIRGGFGGHQIKGYRNLKSLSAKIAATSFQISKEEALPFLPERERIVIPVTLSLKTRRAYDRMKADSLVRIEAHDAFGRPRTGVAFATIVLTEMLRLQQITSGFLPVNYGHEDSEIIKLGDDKLKIAVDLTQDANANGERVVIFCRFKPDLQHLVDALPNAGVISGAIKGDKRDNTIKRFQEGRYDALIVQISTGSESIDLTAASVAIFYSYNHSLLDFNQARDRIHRHGQTKRVLEYVLVAEHSIDGEIMKALVNKQDISRQVTSRAYVRKLFK